MRVLHVLSSTAFHGAESMTAELVRQLAPLGVENHIALFDNAGRCDRRILEVTAGQLRGEVTIPCAGALDSAAFGALDRYLQTHDIDVVHSHKYKTTFYALPVARRRRRGMVTTYHNWVETTPALRLYGWLDRRIARYNHVSVAVSSRVHATLSTCVPRERLRQIDNGIDTAVFVPGSEGPALRASLGFGPDTLVFGCVGRLSVEKGLDRLVEVLARLPRAPAWGLIVVGDGDQRPALEAQAAARGVADRVRFLGHRDDTAQLYRAMDVYLLPSRLEAFPMALLEAMASGCAVVAADVGDVARILDQGRCGRVVGGEGAEGWIAALQAELETRATQRARGLQARQRVVEHYSGPAMARAYVEAYTASLRATGADRRRALRPG